MSGTGFCPFATVRNIPPGANDPAIKPRIAILHVDAGNAESLYTFFRDRSGGIESHFHIKATGEIEQYRSIFWQADANLDANDFAVSIETQGFGKGEWNAAQMASIKKLLLWLHEAADIPLAVCQSWNGSGVGYHTMWGSPSHWTPVAKSCPGPDRIRQFNDVIRPWLKTAAKPVEMTRGAGIDRLIAATEDRIKAAAMGSRRERILKASLALLLTIHEFPKK